MCRAATCRQCGRPTWKGCGQHVEQVLGHVPQSQRCHCGTATGSGADATSVTPRRRGFRRR